MNTRLFQHVKATAKGALVVGVCLPLMAQAIPANQRDVETASVSTTSASFVLVPATSVNVNNGTTARDCVIQFSADASSEFGDGIDVAFAIGAAGVGAGACNTSGGPFFFYVARDVTTSPADPGQTATVVHVRNIGTGTRTVKACYRFLNFNGNRQELRFLANAH